MKSIVAIIVPGFIHVMTPMHSGRRGKNNYRFFANFLQMIKFVLLNQPILKHCNFVGPFFSLDRTRIAWLLSECAVCFACFRLAGRWPERLVALISLINVALRLFFLRKYSRPYPVIKDPSSIYFWKKSLKNWVKIEKSGYFQRIIYMFYKNSRPSVSSRPLVY